MLFGSITSKIAVDDGSTVESVTNYFNGKPTQPSRLRYEVRTKVKADSEADAIAMVIVNLLSDPRNLEPQVKVDLSKAHKDGHYFLISCYTRLERVKIVVDDEDMV